MSQDADRVEADADEPGGPAPRFNRQAVAAIAVAIVVLIGGGIFLLGRGGTPVPTTTTTTTAEPVATTTIKKLPVGTYEVATVKTSVSKIQVRADAPPEWDSGSKTVVGTGVSDPPPLSQSDAPKKPPIPSDKEPVTGRYVAAGGWEFSNPGPYEPPQPLTFLVVERRGEWLQVLLPVRPNGTLGYIKNSDVELSTTQKRIEIHVAEHKFVLYDGDQVVVETPIVTGVAFSPTPTGVFYVTDVVPYKNPDGFYGPYALATNGYSEVLNEFDGGVPVLAVHGTNRPELMGQDKSNGCIRLPNDVIDTVAKTAGLGTPVLIWP